MVKAIPENYPRVTPYLHVDGARKAIEFYTNVFGATERMTMPGPDGKIGHSELNIGNSVIMLADEFHDMGARGPHTVGGSPVTIHVFVEDVDATIEKAVQAGAKVTRPIETRFYGDRAGEFEDPFGHRWSVGSHVEDVSPEEIQKRMSEMMSE